MIYMIYNICYVIYEQLRKKQKRTKKSRERYKLRKLNTLMKEATENNNSVINLSSLDLTLAQMYALQLGHGFIPTPNNRVVEETLILEGFRVLNNIGIADKQLDERDNKPATATVETDNGVEEILELFNSSSENSFSGFNDDEIAFNRSKKVPSSLRFSNPSEQSLSQRTTKLLKKEFENFNKSLITKSKQKVKNKHFNLPSKVRNAITDLKKLVSEKKLDIRKVDKGQLILVIDYSQRKMIEEKNISDIAKRCTIQESNWEENREFIDTHMKCLFTDGFISKEELTAVTGILAGGGNW